jgi:hypothetical protein
VAEENIEQFDNIIKKLEVTGEGRFELMSVKAFIFALNNLWRYIDNLMEKQNKEGQEIASLQNR